MMDSIEVTTATPLTCQWCYLDTKELLQGPFSSEQMAEWCEYWVMPEGLKVRRTTDVDFATIQQYFPKPLVPFRSAPANPRAAQKDAGEIMPEKVIAGDAVGDPVLTVRHAPASGVGAAKAMPGGETILGGAAPEEAPHLPPRGRRC